MAGTELLISIVSQATGKGFLESEKSVKKLQKNVKSLGKTIGVTFAVGAVVAFGKAAVKAFSEDEKAAIKLSRAVENLGIGFANPAINKFIADLERSAGVADDVLRPAFQNLLTTTGSLTKSQELLNNAITISRASGVDLATVTDDLTKAYLGSNKGLEKYNTGLTKAEIESKSFSEVLGVLLKQSAGAAEDYLSSTAYQMEVLSIAGVNASEIIGGGLVDAFAMIAGGTEASDAAIGIEMVATAVANLARGAGAAVSGIPTLLKSLKNLPKNIFSGFAGASAGINITTPTETNKLTVSQKKQRQALAKLEVAAVKRAKQLADLAKKQANAEILKRKEKEKQAKLDKAALSLGKAEDVFDLDQIQIAAAILSTQENIQRLGVNATDQQKLQLANDAQRLTVKQLMLDLEDAIAAKDVERATSLSKQLNTELAILGTLTGQTYKLGQIDKILASFVPKDLINLDNLDAAIRKLLEIAGSRFDFLSPIITSQDRSNINNLDKDIFTRYKAGDPEAVRAVEAHADAISMLAESELALANALFAESIRALDIATASLSPSVATSSRGFDPAAFRMADNITINVNAGVIGSEDTVEQAVQRAILSLERKGDPLRYTGGL
jgi:hypothetical protein